MKHRSIPKKRYRPVVELLENRLVPSTVPTFTVTTAVDNNVAHPGKVSLRDAINDADNNNDPGVVDIIKFSSSLAGKTITLNTGLGALNITESVDIVGLGASKLKLDGGAVNGTGGTQIFQLVGGDAEPNHVTISGLTLQNGNYQSSFNPEVDGGGAIGTSAGFGINFFGPTQADGLTVQSCVFTKNQTNGVGGAIQMVGGNLTIQDSVFTNNTSGNEGGAILFDDAGNNVHLLMQRDTVAGNKTTGIEQGGGLCIQGGNNNLIDSCTFSGNVSGQEGGAIANRPTGTELPVPTNSAITLIEDSTIYGNSAATVGGAIWNLGSSLTLLNDTVAGNTSSAQGGGVFNDFGVVNIYNTIVSGNTAAGIANDIGIGDSPRTNYNAEYSLIQVSAAGAINGVNSHNIFGVSPDLGPLQNNGGPTLTLNLKLGSPALRAGSTTLLVGLTHDQRGVARTFPGTVSTVDMGAVEASLNYRHG